MIIQRRARTSKPADLVDPSNRYGKPIWRCVAICVLSINLLVAWPLGVDAGDDAKPESSKAATTDSAQEDLDLASNNGQFELLVVGPDRKPVPDAEVEFWPNKSLTADDVSKGAFIKAGKHTLRVKTDSSGRIVVKFSGGFRMNIITPGFGPYFANWMAEDNSQSIPARFTAELDAAWSVGCVVVDPDGNPVEGVTIHPRIKSKDRPGHNSMMHIGVNEKTDRNGQWHFDSVPEALSEVSVLINHPDFMAQELSLTQTGFKITPGEEPASKIVLDRGVTVTGKVTDDDGKPITGASIRSKAMNDLREAVTDEQGRYSLKGCAPRMTRIVAYAKNHAIEMQDVQIEPKTEPVDFELQPGGKIRVQVQDLAGNPIPKARIFFQEWRGGMHYFEFERVNKLADENGVWEWNEAPVDEVKADIGSNAMFVSRRPLIAQDEPYVFRIPPTLVISGRVIDARTKESVKKFQVTAGVRSAGPNPGVSWQDHQKFTASAGQYKLRQNYEQFAYLVRIEAEGYQTAESRDIKSYEGAVSIDFELNEAETKGRPVNATVLAPDGQPAARAQVAVAVAQSHIGLLSGRMNDSQCRCFRVDTDESGKFKAPPQSMPFQVMISHPAGYARINAEADSPPDTIRLEPWATVAGTFRIGKKPIANAPITVDLSRDQGGRSRGSVYAQYDTTTGEDGQFAFDRLFPGHASISRRITIMADEGAVETASTIRLGLELISGETTQVDLGGIGQPVVGQVKAYEGFEGPAEWQFATVHLVSKQPLPAQPAKPQVPEEIQGDKKKTAEWLSEWRKTEEGKAYTAWAKIVNQLRELERSAPTYLATVNRDGGFKIDNVPAGNYSLSIRFARNSAGVLPNYPFSVPQIDGDSSDEEFDLGLIQLQQR